jgi:hypothetical protein
MAKSKKRQESTSAEQYTYRGRQIEIKKGGEKDSFGRETVELLIDGHAIELEQSEHGVSSHALMFREFSTPQELAEELVKQWGSAKPEPVSPHRHHHDHK